MKALKHKIKNPKAWAENELKKMIAKYILKYMDEWLTEDDVRGAVERARDEMLCIAYELAPREDVESNDGDNLIEDANTN